MIFRNEANILLICLYGLMNGIAILFGSNTLNFWIASYKIDIEVIGFFAIISLPQAFKYFISIFIDEVQLFYLSKKYGNSKAWLIFSQSIIILSLYLMSFLDPNNNIKLIALLGFILSTMAVIQYVILNSHRISLLLDSMVGIGSAVYNIGYRLGMFFTGAGVIYISIFCSWKIIFYILALLYFILSSMVIKYYHEDAQNTAKSSWLRNDQSLIMNILSNPIKHFGTKNFIWIILLILLYQLSDSMFMVMLNPFLLFKNYSFEEIANASKICGLVMVIIGSFIGGILTDKFKINQCLFLFSIIHSLGYLMFFYLANIEKNIAYLYFITGYVSFTGGMATTSYFSLITRLSKGEHSSKLYSFLSSIIGVSWAVFPSISGVIVQNLSWNKFFIIIFLLSILTSFFTLIVPKSIYNQYSLN